MHNYVHLCERASDSHPSLLHLLTSKDFISNKGEKMFAATTITQYDIHVVSPGLPFMDVLKMPLLQKEKVKHIQNKTLFTLIRSISLPLTSADVFQLLVSPEQTT